MVLAILALLQAEESQSGGLDLLRFVIPAILVVALVAVVYRGATSGTRRASGRGASLEKLDDALRTGWIGHNYACGHLDGARILTFLNEASEGIRVQSQKLNSAGRVVQARSTIESHRKSESDGPGASTWNQLLDLLLEDLHDMSLPMPPPSE